MLTILITIGEGWCPHNIQTEGLFKLLHMHVVSEETLLNLLFESLGLDKAGVQNPCSKL
jgi:hypothetical protein